MSSLSVDTEDGQGSALPVAFSPPKSPVSRMDGWLSRKSVTKNMFGKSQWVKYWAVLDPELWAIRFYNTQQDAFCHSDEAGEISLQRLQEIKILTDKKNGRRFNVTSHDGLVHCLLTASVAETLKWVERIKPYKSVAMPRMSVSLSESPSPESHGDGPGGIVEPRPATPDETAESEPNPPPPLPTSGSTSSVEARAAAAFAAASAEVKGGAEAPVTRERSFTDLLDVAADNAKGGKAPSIKAKVTEYVVRTGFGDEEVDVTQTVDKTYRTTHVTWQLSLGPKSLLIELFHGRVWGKRKINVNGVTVHKSRNVLDAGSRHLLNIQGRKLIVNIASPGFSGFKYFLDSEQAPAPVPQDKDLPDQAAAEAKEVPDESVFEPEDEEVQQVAQSTLTTYLSEAPTSAEVPEDLPPAPEPAPVEDLPPAVPDDDVPPVPDVPQEPEQEQEQDLPPPVPQADDAEAPPVPAADEPPAEATGDDAGPDLPPELPPALPPQ